MRNNLGKLRVPAAAATVVALVALGAAPATASDHGNDPISTLIGNLDLQPSNVAPEDGAGSVPAPAPTDDSDSPGHETADPSSPDHGGASVADADVAGQDVADVGSNKATTRDDDGTSADSTLLALGGQEIMGAHADSTGSGESHFGDWLAPLCSGSDGQLCLRVLYADAIASDNGTTSHSQSRSGIASACLGGTSSDPNAECDGPVAAGAATSSGQSDRDQSSGRTTASSQSDLVDVCLKQPGATAAGCGLGAQVLHSDGQADSGGAQPSASRDSYLLGVEANGENQGRADQPQGIGIQPDCADPSLVCAYLNQGETYVGDRVAGHAQDALDARVAPGTPIEVSANLSRSETLVHNDGGEQTTANRAPKVLGEQLVGGPRSPGGSGGGLAGVLPNTGGVWTGLLAGGLGAVGLGALLMAFSRRRAANALV